MGRATIAVCWLCLICAGQGWSAGAEVAAGNPPRTAYKVDEERLGRLPGAALIQDSAVSKDGCHYACVATGRDSQLLLVVNGRPGVDCTGIVKGSLAIGPGGQPVVYQAGRGAERFLVVDRKPGPGYVTIYNGPVVSSNSGRVAHAAGSAREVMD
jgi:hypothetical protein